MDRSEIDEVIAYIHRHLDEPLPLSRLANHVAYSQYHFARIFKERIGLPPLYYVSTMRLQRAKDLLLRTNMSVRDIGLEIGQQSLGTFSTRFTERVGVSPSEFRETAQLAEDRLRSLQQLTEWTRLHPAPRATDDHCRDNRVHGAFSRRHFDWIVCQADSGRPSFIRNIAALARQFLFYQCQAGHILLDGDICCLGHAGDGFSLAVRDIAHTFQETNHCHTNCDRPSSASYSSCASSGRPSHLDFSFFAHE